MPWNCQSPIIMVDNYTTDQVSTISVFNTVDERGREISSDFCWKRNGQLYYFDEGQIIDQYSMNSGGGPSLSGDPIQ